MSKFPFLQKLCAACSRVCGACGRVAAFCSRAGVPAKSVLGPLFPIFVFIVLNLALLSLSRLGLAIWQNERVSAVGGWRELLLQGVRVDFASMGWLLPAVASALFWAETRFGCAWRVVLRVWLTAGTTEKYRNHFARIARRAIYRRARRFAAFAEF